MFIAYRIHLDFLLSRPQSKESLEKWHEAISAVQRFVDKMKTYVCMLHFNPDDIIRNDLGQLTLKADAIPTIFPEKRIKYGVE